MIKVIASWSGGKDSCFACYKALQEGHNVAHLFNTIAADHKRVRFHGIPAKFLKLQASATGIPLVQLATTSDNYEKEFTKALSKIVTKENIEAMVFGDIFPHMCKFAEGICKNIGIKALEPLKGKTSEEIFLDFINSGFKTIVVSTQSNLLGPEWIGRVLDKSFLDDIKKLPNIDICGENGEYHTFVIDGPIFKSPLQITKSEKVLRNGYWFLDIQKVIMEPYMQLNLP